MASSDNPYNVHAGSPPGHVRWNSDVHGPSPQGPASATPSANVHLGDGNTDAERGRGTRDARSSGSSPAGERYRNQRRYTPTDVNYKDKYEPDPYGEELGPKARVWSVYNDEAWRADGEQTQRLNGTLDVLLVFAGLFSAVITTFVAQSSLKLEPDYAKITASLVYEMVLMQRAMRTGSPASDVPNSELVFDSETYRTPDLWVNGLWLTSLTLSLVTALASVLAKQWIQYFTSPTGTTPREHAHVRQYRLDNFRRWNVPFIIGLLPVLLTFALFLFLAGLAVYTTPGNSTISFIVIGFSAAITLVYAVSIVLPIFVTHCPYKTAISDYIMILPRLVYSIAKSTDGIDLPSQLQKSYFEEQERAAVQRQSIPLTESALDWLYTSSSNASAATISLQAAFVHLTRRDREGLNIQSAFMCFIGVILLPSWRQLLIEAFGWKEDGPELQPGPEPKLAKLTRDLLSRGSNRLAKLWKSPSQMARWRKYQDDLTNLESGLREVTFIIMHIRDLSQRDPENKSRDLLLDVQRLVGDLIPLLPQLFLHPVVWRDLELAILYCLSLVEVKETSLPGQTESLELPLKATGDPLQHLPMTLAEYTRVRRGKKEKQVKKGEEKLAKDLQKLHDDALPQILKQQQAKGPEPVSSFASPLRRTTSTTTLLDVPRTIMGLILGASRGTRRHLLRAADRIADLLYPDTDSSRAATPSSDTQQGPVAEGTRPCELGGGSSENVHMPQEATNIGTAEGGTHGDAGATSPVHAQDTRCGGFESPTPGTQAEGVTEHVTDVAPSATDDPRFDDPRPSRAVAGPDLRAQGTDLEKAPAALDADSAEQPIVLPWDPLPFNEEPEEGAH